jgi:hypothetical protein
MNGDDYMQCQQAAQSGLANSAMATVDMIKVANALISVGSSINCQFNDSDGGTSALNELEKRCVMNAALTILCS